MTHSNYATNVEQIEKEENIIGIKQCLDNHGWNRWQWRNDKEHCFVEVFSDNFHGYLRGDSKTSLKDACEKVLNQVMKMNECESKTGHTYKTYKDYDNGLIECVNCGFNGYTNIFENTIRKIDNHRINSRVHQEGRLKDQQALKKIGFAFNGFNGVLIQTELDGENNYKNIDMKLYNQKVHEQIVKVLVKTKVIKL